MKSWITALVLFSAISLLVVSLPVGKDDQSADKEGHSAHHEEEVPFVEDTESVLPEWAQRFLHQSGKVVINIINNMVIY